ncbi:MAG: PAS domain S-box protein [Candidatus Bathyarchaeia archaeon]
MVKRVKALKGRRRDTSRKVDRKRIEESLRKSEQLYKQTSAFLNNVLSHMSDLVQIIDEGYTIRFMNEVSNKIYGNVVGEKCYKIMRNFDRPCHHEGIRCELYELLEGKVNLFEETRFIPTVGRIFDIHATLTTMPDGKRAAIIVSRDVTEEKKAIDKLRESEKRYRTLFEDSRDAISITTREGKYVDINQAYADLFGYTKEELLRININETYVTPEDRGKMLQEIERRGFIKDYEVKRRRKDGREIHCLVTSTPLRREDGSIVGYQTIIRDVTEQKRMMEKLQFYSEHLEEMVEEKTVELQYRLNLDRLLASISSKFVNPIDFEGKVNSSLAELGRHFNVDRVFIFECHGGGNLTKIFEWRREGVEPQLCRLQNLESKMFPWLSGKLINNEEIIISEVGKLPPEAEAERKMLETQGIASVLAVPMHSSDRLLGFIGFADLEKPRVWKVEDVELLRAISEVITRSLEHIRMEQRLREVERLAAIGEATTMMGHDLRNPLQSIISSVYLVKRKIEAMPPTFKRLMEESGIFNICNILESQAKYIDKIVADLHDFSRPLHPKLVETNVSKLVSEALSTMSIPDNIEVSLRINDDLTLTADPNLMRRLFTNLMMNAVQAMPDGGKLTIEASRQDEETFISFQDTGVGIPQEIINKLFEPFFTTKSKGQGLGLAVCKRIIEAHKGVISVESKVGEGSTFTIRLPSKVNM